jgi:hypothetical protein
MKKNGSQSDPNDRRVVAVFRDILTRQKLSQTVADF